MQNKQVQVTHWTKPLFYLSALVACSVMALTSGCASGGFKLTRQYAGWVNSQNIILRIILYILTGVVFAVTLLIDSVIFNTIDFWEGRVSQGTYDFKNGDKTYVVRHELTPDTQLKRSTIRVMDSSDKLVQEIVLSETLVGEIEMYVDGKIQARVHGVSEVPLVSIFDGNGRVLEQRAVVLAPALAVNRVK